MQSVRNPPLACVSLKTIGKGNFVRGYNTSGNDPDGRPLWSESYVPCDVEGWCNSTNGFDCSQVQYVFFSTLE